MKNWKLWTVLALIVVVMGVSGCNTIRGAGKDIQRGGQKVQEVAS